VVAGLVACLTYSLETIRSSVTDNSALLGFLELGGIPYFWRVGLAALVGLGSWVVIYRLVRSNPERAWRFSHRSLAPVLVLCILASWFWP